MSVLKNLWKHSAAYVACPRWEIHRNHFDNHCLSSECGVVKDTWECAPAHTPASSQVTCLLAPLFFTPFSFISCATDCHMPCTIICTYATRKGLLCETTLIFSDSHQPCLLLKQWFSIFPTPWCFNTVPPALVTSDHKIILLLLHSCNLPAVMNCNVMSELRDIYVTLKRVKISRRSQM